MSKCLGCGVELQNTDINRDGYVESLDHELCHRCFIIKNYGQNKVINKSNIDYEKIINKITSDDLVIYVSSLLTLNLDYIDGFKNVILVLTKRDILPKSVKDNKIINYVKKRHNNIIDVIIVSAYKKYNLDCLYNLLNRNKNRKIYFVGITNSGKSTLINEMIKCYSDNIGNITTSSYPSTTLDLVDVKIGDIKVKDTPGLVIDDSIINYLDSKEIKKINNKKEVKPITFQINGKGAILIDDLFRIEYNTVSSSMTCYMANSLNVESISLKNSKMNDLEFSEYSVSTNQDLVIEDIGFIKCTNGVEFKIYSKYKAYIYVRDNLI